MNKSYQSYIKTLLLTLAVLAIANVVSTKVYKRFDLTQDNRYTISTATTTLLSTVDQPIEVTVYLQGDFPMEFKRLQQETKQLLEEFALANNNISYKFIDPLQKGESENDFIQELYQDGLKPLSLTVNDKGVQTQRIVVPWAVVQKAGKTAKVQLLKDMLGADTQQKVLVSVEHLEYALAQGIEKVNFDKQKTIAVLKGNGELDDMYIADFLLNLAEKYHIAPFTLSLDYQSPESLSEQLNNFDLAIIAKPTQSFSEAQIGVLDQYVMQGGKTLWLLDQVQADFDSLRAQGTILAYNKDQSLGELLFKYGVRINPVLVRDEMATPIKLAIGKQGSQTQYGEFLWKFAPFVYPHNVHPIIRNIEAVKLEFASSIDTLKNGVTKTVLLQSSQYATVVGTPVEIGLDDINAPSEQSMYKDKGNYIMGVLLEGEFTSVFNNRVFPYSSKNTINKSDENKMIVIADGDIVKNQLDANLQPLELGYDKWVNKLYGNKEFLLNSVNYLLDDRGLLELRSKEVKIPLLDKLKVYNDYNKIQITTLGVPIVIVLLLAGVFFVLRKRVFSKK